MKILYVLPVLLALPVGAFAGTENWKVRPFVAYDLNLVDVQRLAQHGPDLDNKRTTCVFNDSVLNGSFVFGAEVYDFMAVSVKPRFFGDNNKYRDAYRKEIYTDLDFYLTRKSNFKPYVSLSVGYIDLPLNRDVDSSYVYYDALNQLNYVFYGPNKFNSFKIGAGMGLKYFVNDNVFFGSRLSYARTTRNCSYRLYETNLNVSLGYRF